MARKEIDPEKYLDKLQKEDELGYELTGYSTRKESEESAKQMYKEWQKKELPKLIKKDPKFKDNGFEWWIGYESTSGIGELWLKHKNLKPDEIFDMWVDKEIEDENDRDEDARVGAYEMWQELRGKY